MEQRRSKIAQWQFLGISVRFGLNFGERKACGFRLKELGAGLREKDDLLTIQLEKEMVTFGAAALKNCTVAIFGLD